ncbi:MAG: LysM peptidoglycan-binding domain-containing protein [Alphaproteobacteria bacterium]|nr:LysM peptidoglycan-binding domain-containing protein [Alphaproteobacteria bacterium]
MILAVIGAALIITFTFVRPPEPHRAGLRPIEPPAPPPQAQHQPAAPAAPRTAAAPPAPQAGTAARAPAEAARPADAPAAAAPATLAGPTFDVVRVSQTCTAVLAGKAMPGMVVVVRFGEREIGRVTADQRGEWVLVPDLPLPSGAQELTAAGLVQGRAEPVPGQEAVALVVPKCAPGEPDPGETAVAVLAPRQGASRLLQPPVPEGDVSAAKGLNLDTVDYNDAGLLILSGRAIPRTTVQIYLNNQPLGTAVADERGRWTLTPRDLVDPGIYTLRVDQVQEAGRVAARVEVPFSHARPEELRRDGGRIIVQPGNSLWRIARRTYGEGELYTVIYRANREQIRDPDLIYPGQIFDIPESPVTPEPPPAPASR